jgi:hypothetical protein
MWGYVISAFVLGLVMGMASAVVLQQMSSERAQKRRHFQRALMGLDPERVPTRSGAKGHARVHSGDYIPERWQEADDLDA